MSFGAPIFLVALVAVALAAIAYLVAERHRRRGEAAFAAPAVMPSVVRRRPGWRRHAPIALYGLALAGLVVALAQPQKTVAVPDGRAAVMLTTDQSSSMAATDVRPSRLAAARKAARRFLKDVPGEVKVGSVGFDDRVRQIESPRTARAPVRRAIDALAAGGGTATGEAIAASLRSLGRARGPRGRYPAAIVLLSDGFSTSGRDPIEAAREARRKGVRIYTVSVGTERGTIEVPRRRGGTITRRVPPDSASLREIARVTRARAYRAGDEVKLDAVYRDLGDRVDTRKEKRQVTSAFAGGALLLLGAGGAMSLAFFGRLP
ncbi:MAG: VWA domain-containing protein [Thermoleophilaceae bacterium]